MKKQIHKSNEEVGAELLKRQHDDKVRTIVIDIFKPLFDRTEGGIKESIMLIAMAARFVEIQAKKYAEKVSIKDLGVEVPIEKGDIQRVKFDAIYEECKDVPVSDFIEAVNMFTSKLQDYILAEGVKKESKEYDIDKILKEKTS